LTANTAQIEATAGGLMRNGLSLINGPDLPANIGITGLIKLSHNHGRSQLIKRIYVWTANVRRSYGPGAMVKKARVWQHLLHQRGTRRQDLQWRS
jgi:hypothetical protein